MSTISESISRVRNGLKAVKEEAFLTDRYIYSLLIKYGKSLIERENRTKNIYRNEKMFHEIPFFELTDVDIIETCGAISTGCTIKRSIDKLPTISSVNGGVMIKYVSTIDHSVELKRTSPEKYNRMKNMSSFKYNKTKYYWISNGYIYVPDVDYEAISISAAFEEDISQYLCDTGTTKTICTNMQEGELPIPEHLLSEVEQYVRQEIMPMLQIPVDSSTDKQNIIR